MLKSIKILRAIAALLVVFYHSQTLIIAKNFTQYTYTNLGASGVDIFFVLSGFVMIYVSYDHFRLPHSSLNFLRNRITRIVPTYYLFISFSTFMLILNLKFDLKLIITSYLFILSSNNAGQVTTLVGGGWTLCFEAFFYAVFAILLRFKRKYLLPSLTSVFIIGNLVRIIFGNPYPWAEVVTNPLVFEFLFGCCIGMLYKNGKELSKTICVLMIAIGTIWIYLASGMGMVTNALAPMRVYAWGIPSAFIVAGTIFLEKQVEFKVPRIILLIADSSFSIYLINLYVIRYIELATRIVLSKIYLPSISILIISIVICSISGVLCYYIYERTVTDLLKNYRKALKADGETQFLSQSV